MWKCPLRLQRYSFITTLFLGPFDDVITEFYCIYSYPPKLKEVSSILNLRTCHAVVTRFPPNMDAKGITQENKRDDYRMVQTMQ
jgi:hypothetical protein